MPDADPLVTGEPGGFDDHAVRELRSIDDFEALSKQSDTGQSVAKFLIPDLLGGDAGLSGDVYWLDSNFYELHDEWVYFRLLNNQPVPGFIGRPLDEDRRFETVAEIYEHFEGVANDDLPGDLRWTPPSRPGERLYLGEFYAQALQYQNDRDVYGNYDSRTYGMGSIVRTTPTSISASRWLMELQFSDRVTPEDVARYFESIIATVPDEIGSSLEWIIRSAEQEDTASEMQANDLAFADRVVRYDEIVPPGQVDVYNEGIAAGRLLLVEEGGKQLSDATDTDIVIIERVPDYLPPANALITSDPQTPLAHVNLLARNRGIPNASRAGLLDDESIRRNAAARAPVVVRTRGNGELEIHVIRSEDYATWWNLREQQPIKAPPIPSGSIEPVLNLTELAETIDDQSDVDALLPVIGGKAAGFLSLLSADDVTTPPNPLVITTPMYEQHLENVDAALAEMLAIEDFDERQNAWLRVLLLEGEEAFDELYDNEVDRETASAFMEKNPVGTALGAVIEAGGFAKLFRAAPMNETSLATITSVLEQSYGNYSASQGLRFRSSSSVEDIEGFSGAGLYDSNTGFLDAAAQDDGDRKKTIERTIKKTWASYWGFEAYEERRREKVDHRSGAMAVLVHARFDDDLELANGVATFRINPSSGPDADRSVATINVQAGAVSVTNPDPTVIELPEIVEIRVNANGSQTTSQLGASTLSPDESILSNADLGTLHRQLEAVAELWLGRLNESLNEDQQLSTVTLDYEFKLMASGWPARDSGSLQSSRIVVKQARSLDPGLRGFDEQVLSLPVPRDVLARARRVVRVSCDGQSHVDVYTSPLVVPDIGFSEMPFATSTDHAGEELDGGCTQDVLFSDPDEFLAGLLQKSN